MVFNSLTFIVDDNYLHTRPSSPPAFMPSPEASPRACIACIGVIGRFDELQLGDGSRDGGAVEEMQGENPGGRNGSAGIVNRIGGGMRKVIMNVHMSGRAPRFYFFALPDRRSKALRLVAGLPGVQSVALTGDRDQIKVIGEVDMVHLTILLRKKVGFAEIASVSYKNEGENEDNPGETEDVEPHMAIPAP